MKPFILEETIKTWKIPNGGSIFHQTGELWGSGGRTQDLWRTLNWGDKTDSSLLTHTKLQGLPSGSLSKAELVPPGRSRPADLPGRWPDHLSLPERALFELWGCLHWAPGSQLFWAVTMQESALVMQLSLNQFCSCVHQAQLWKYRTLVCCHSSLWGWQTSFLCPQEQCHRTLCNEEKPTS